VVEVQVGEESIGKVKKDQRATVRVISFGDAATFSGKVEKILPAASAQTQRYTVFLEVDIDPARLTPGTTGEALINIDERENALQIPRKALIGTNAFVVRNGVVDIRDVQVGFISLNQAEILSGLEEGEHVIVEELDLFSSGQRVRIEAFSEN
jgi:multidrug efflux pump subunit AcrA (membrane-fusion protein)